jgi:hypothetical protein
MKRGMWVGKILMFVLIGIFIAFGFVMGTMYIWNWLVPELFSGPIINFWQTLGLLVLSKIFFWSFGSRCHCRQGHANGPWKYYWKDKWSNMAPEDRERFKQKMKEKWCYKPEDKSTGNSGTSNG